jgi:hypothetical protein
MRDYDLTTPSGKQAFERFIVELIRNEINSYTRQVLADRASAININDGTSLSDTDRITRLEQAIFRG